MSGTFNFRKFIRTLFPKRVLYWIQVIRGTWGDRCLGIRTQGWYQLQKKDFELMAIPDGMDYQAASYHLLKQIFVRIPFDENDICIDLGCGKGRVICLLAKRYKLKKVIGVDILPSLTEVARENAERIKPLTPLEILTADVTQVDLSQATIYFLFNPFGEGTMRRVLDLIQLGLETNPRQVKIVYFNPLCREIFSGYPWLRPFATIDYRVAIWENVPACGSPETM